MYVHKKLQTFLCYLGYVSLAMMEEIYLCVYYASLAYWKKCDLQVLFISHMGKNKPLFAYLPCDMSL